MVEQLGKPIVALSQQESSDMVDMSKLDPNKRLGWNKRVEVFMQKCMEQGKAFCHHCAIIAYDEYKTVLKKKTQNKLQMGGGNPVDFNPEFKCDMNQFVITMKYVSENVKSDTRIINGTKINFPVRFANYRCTECNGGHSMELPDIVKKS